MRIILRTMDLPGKSAALYRPRKSPIGYNSVVADAGLAVMSGEYVQVWAGLQTALSLTFSNYKKTK